MNDYVVKSVERACILLGVLAEHPKGLGVTELAQEVSMYKSTVYRLLTTLINQGFVEQNTESGKYSLGYALVDLGMKLLSSIDLRDVAAPFLETLAHSSHEVAHLAILEHGLIVYVDKVESRNATRMHSRVGKRVPVHATGLGKAILGFLPEQETLAILGEYGMPALTKHTITDSIEFMESLKKVREHGYAVDVEENEEGISCVAAPILDSTGRVIAACSVSGSSLRVDKQFIEQVIPQVKDAGQGISARLGYGLSV